MTCSVHCAKLIWVFFCVLFLFACLLCVYGIFGTVYINRYLYKHFLYTQTNWLWFDPCPWPYTGWLITIKWQLTHKPKSIKSNCLNGDVGRKKKGKIPKDELGDGDGDMYHNTSSIWVYTVTTYTSHTCSHFLPRKSNSLH